MLQFWLIAWNWIEGLWNGNKIIRVIKFNNFHSLDGYHSRESLSSTFEKYTTHVFRLKNEKRRYTFSRVFDV